MQNLADFIRLKNPKRIGINASPTSPLADGLTASQRDKLAMSPGPELSTRLTSAENLCVGRQETRNPLGRKTIKVTGAGVAVAKRPILYLLQND